MTASITDFNQFTEMRAAADRRDPAVLREVAGQFEALFLQMMLKNMRAASFGDSLMGDNKQHELYRDMMDQQLSLDMASGKGIGLADSIVRQLGGTPDKRVTEAMPVYRPVNAAAPAKVYKHSADSNGGVDSTRPVQTAQDSVASSATASNAGNRKSDWHDPVSFAKAVWPHVKRAAGKLNVSPVGVLAQAALETGWGAKVMHGNDGNSSLNLFGIKAASGWQGEAVSKRTIEFDGGVARQEVARFRAYPDVASTFTDYADFLGNNPRYETVKNTGNDVAEFARALADSGYATDPRYAEKIEDIFRGPTMQRVLASLGDAGGAGL